MTTAGASATPDAPDERRWRVLAVCLSVGFITMLDVSIVNVAMPSIETALGAGPSALQLVVAGYMLAFGLTLVPSGRLGDAGNRRAIFIIGLVAFALSSLAAGLAPTDEWLVVARLLQGASAGMLNPQIIGLIQQMFSGFERGKAFGLLGASISISTALGPVFGGIIIAVGGPENGWRWIFGVNVPIVAAVLFFALRYVPRVARKTGKRHLDAVGLCLLAVVTVSIMLPFVMTTGVDDDPARWWWLAVAVVVGAVAIVWERRYQRLTGAAVLDPRVIGVPAFRNGALLGLTYYGGFNAIFLVVALFLQDVVGYTPLQAGLVGVAFAAGSALSSGLSGRAVARWGRLLVVTGLSAVVVGLVVIDILIRTISDDAVAIGWAIAAAMLVTGLGNGVVISPNQTLTLAGVPVGQAGVAGSVLQVGARIGSAIGLAVTLSVYYAMTASGSSGQRSMSTAMLLTIGFVLVALVIGIIDLRSRRAGSGPEVRLGA